MTAPSREGTLINAVLQRKERGPDHNKGKRGKTNSASDKATKMTQSKKQQQTVNSGKVQEAKKRAPPKSKQKLNSQYSDNETSCRSKQTKSNDEYWLVGGRRGRQRWLILRR